jgi:hypothetical protein
MRSWGDGFAQLADSYTGSRDDAEQYTKLVAEWISTGCLRVAERYGVPYEFVSGTFMAMLGMRLEAAA